MNGEEDKDWYRISLVEKNLCLQIESNFNHSIRGHNHLFPDSTEIIRSCTLTPDTHNLNKRM